MTPIQFCEDYARSQQYCWFRITFAKIGQFTPGWIAWFEGLGQPGEPDFTQCARSMNSAVKSEPGGSG